MLRRLHAAVIVGIFVGVVGSTLGAGLTVFASDGVEFRSGDRVVLLGGTFVERLQVHGYWETRLVAALGERNLTFRNLGWSGDTVWGEARAVFGGPQDGFQRLMKDTLDAKPSLILLQYGANEATAGPAGLPEFTLQLNRLLDALASTKARIVLLSPVRREKLPPPLPDPTTYNQHLELYADALAQVAKERQLPYVNLLDLYESPLVESSRQGTRPFTFTDNGLHPHEAGSAVVAERLLNRLGLDTKAWSIEVEGTAVKATGIDVRELTRSANGVRFTATPKQLPPPTTYQDRQPAGPGKSSPAARVLSLPHQLSRLRVSGLDPGNYDLWIDGEKVASADATLWSDSGVSFMVKADVEQADAVRQLVYDKNVLYFHRYRPQNETYLFLFRKHEQGNNAVEIPQFDPLIEEKEAEIGQRRVPKQRVYELKRAG